MPITSNKAILAKLIIFKPVGAVSIKGTDVSVKGILAVFSSGVVVSITSPEATSLISFLPASTNPAGAFNIPSVEMPSIFKASVPKSPAE